MQKQKAARMCLHTSWPTHTRPRQQNQAIKDAGKVSRSPDGGGEAEPLHYPDLLSAAAWRQEKQAVMNRDGLRAFMALHEAAEHFSGQL